MPNRPPRRVPSKQDHRWLAAAAALAERGRPLSAPNPAVGAIIVRDGVVLGQGWTREGGRPHAEAAALEQAGSAARGSTLYVTLEPCAHASPRGPACSDIVAEAGLARVVIGVQDPDHRTDGSGMTRLRDAGIEVVLAEDSACAASLEGYLVRRTLGRPHITLKLATSLDGCIALASGESRWITGPQARAHVHRERARAEGICVGGGTMRTDDPLLDVRLPGLETRSPQRFVLTGGEAPQGWSALTSPDAIHAIANMQYLFVEGGAEAAAAFLRTDLVDRLLLYRAPVLIGGGKAALGDIGLKDLSAAHGRWQRTDKRQLGSDTLEVYARTRQEN